MMGLAIIVYIFNRLRMPKVALQLSSVYHIRCDKALPENKIVFHTLVGTEMFLNGTRSHCPNDGR